MEADQLGRLRDILEATRLIASYVKNTAEADFRADTLKDAVVRRIEIIREATAHLNEETRRAVPELPFRENARDAKHRSPQLCKRGPEHSLAGRHHACPRSWQRAREVLCHAAATREKPLKWPHRANRDR